MGKEVTCPSYFLGSAVPKSKFVLSAACGGAHLSKTKQKIERIDSVLSPSRLSSG
jgi:hypothetical protein